MPEPYAKVPWHCRSMKYLSMRITSLLILALCCCRSIQVAHGFQINRRTTPKAPLNAHKSGSLPLNNPDQQRRTLIQQLAQFVFTTPVLGQCSSASANSSSGSSPPQVTHKVFMDIRISRADGTFYIRDNVEDPTDEPFYAHLVLGLFGNEAPNIVQQFLKYVDVPFDLDNPNPSYSTTRFNTLDSATGLLIGGISGLDVTTIAGGSVLEYKGRVIPAKLWLEGTDTIHQKMLHDKKGLLTHRNLDLTPSFGVTTRSISSSLDSTHTVFGCVLEDADFFLDKIVDLPVITSDGMVSRTSINEPVKAGGGNVVASSVFTAQRKIFRDAAKTFGDSRLDKVYDGKLLRRVEVTKVGVL